MGLKIDTHDQLVSALETIMAEINIGLLVYHMEDKQDAEKLKLIYASKQAAKYTSADMPERVGKYILNAFPTLRETDLPDTYLEVIKHNQAQKIGLVEYEDDKMQEGAYSVKAFPLPADCVGIIFEDVTLRKKVDELARKQTVELQQIYDQFKSTLSPLSDEIDNLAFQLESLKDTADSETHPALDKISAGLKKIAAQLS